MKHNADRIAELEESNDRLRRMVAEQAAQLATARLALRTAVENCPCEGVACKRCLPALTAAVEIGCW